MYRRNAPVSGRGPSWPEIAEAATRLAGRAVNRVRYYSERNRRPRVPWGTSALVAGTAIAAQRGRTKKSDKVHASTTSNRQTRKNYGRRTRLTKKRKPNLKRTVKKIKRLVESNMGTLIFRDIESHLHGPSSVNAKSNTRLNGFSGTEAEEAIAQLRYYKPEDQSIINVSGATGAFQREYLFDAPYAKLELRNNYQAPCKVTVRVLTPKKDTNIEPITAWSNGLTDQSNGSTSSVNIYPTDSDQFTDLWSIVKTFNEVVQPGSMMTCSYASKSFQYDPSVYDSHALVYQKSFGTFCFLITSLGMCGHDTVANEQGILQSALDMLLYRTIKIRYDAGADIRYVYVTSSLDSFSNAGVVSSKPVADNISYSLA